MAKVPGTYDNPPERPKPWEDESLSADELDTEINRISGEWQSYGLHPSGLQMDLIPTIAAIAVLVDFLIDKGIIDRDEINIEYKREALRQYTEKLEGVIEQMSKQARAAAAEAGIALPDKRIIGPNGHVIGGNG